jgi:hypothetical protein
MFLVAGAPQSGGDGTTVGDASQLGGVAAGSPGKGYFSIGDSDV